MSDSPSVVVDGIKCPLYHFTGKVTSSEKEKEQQISSQTTGTQGNRQTHVTSTTVDHHEFFLVDKDGNERSFQLVDFDFPCREGQTFSVVWTIPEGQEVGPYFHVRNHNTNETHQIGPNQIADFFKKPNTIIWGSMAGAFFVIGFAIDWIVGMFSILVPFFYFRARSRKAAKSLLASEELRQLDGELANVKPLDA